MAYRSIFTGENVLFFLSDTEVFELSTYDNYKRLVENSEENKDLLIEQIENNLLEAATEEISILKLDENVSNLQKTMAYAKLLQSVFHYQKLKKNEDAELERQARERYLNESEEV